jgi:K+/H+ antiporter YhaU regulatory subunit KhtT
MEQFERSEQVRWWVHLPAQPTRENADRKLAELRRRKVTDVSVVAGENRVVHGFARTVP